MNLLIWKSIDSQVLEQHIESMSVASVSEDPLYRLGLKWNCDKIVHHGYHLIYKKILAPLRDPSRNPPVVFLEIGVEFNR